MKGRATEANFSRRSTPNSKASQPLENVLEPEYAIIVVETSLKIPNQSLLRSSGGVLALPLTYLQITQALWDFQTVFTVIRLAQSLLSYSQPKQSRQMTPTPVGGQATEKDLRPAGRMRSPPTG